MLPDPLSQSLMYLSRSFSPLPPNTCSQVSAHSLFLLFFSLDPTPSSHFPPSSAYTTPSCLIFWSFVVKQVQHNSSRISSPLNQCCRCLWELSCIASNTNMWSLVSVIPSFTLSKYHQFPKLLVLRTLEPLPSWMPSCARLSPITTGKCSPNFSTYCFFLVDINHHREDSGTQILAWWITGCICDNFIHAPSLNFSLLNHR